MKPTWEGDEPPELVYVVNPLVHPPMEQLGAIVHVPPADVDAVDQDGEGGPGGGGPEGGGPRGGGPLDEVDEDEDDNPSRDRGCSSPECAANEPEGKQGSPSSTLDRDNGRSIGD